MIVGVYTVPLTLLLAGPLVYVFRKRLTLARCVTVGFILGMLGSFTFWSPYSLAAFFNWGPLLIVVGVISSLLFWVVGVWGNRDLTKARATAGSGHC
jgi:fluoride ion exporter CrcB/FEX